MFEPLSKYSSTVYKRRFGTWMKALEIFIFYINKEENISSLDGIKNLQAELATKHKTQRGKSNV